MDKRKIKVGSCVGLRYIGGGHIVGRINDDTEPTYQLIKPDGTLGAYRFILSSIESVTDVIPSNLQFRWEVYQNSPKSVDHSPKPANTTTMNTALSYIFTGNGTINAFVQGKAYTLPKDSRFYTQAKDALRAKDADAFVKACDLDKAAREHSKGRVSFASGVLKWNGQDIHDSLTARILALIDEDADFDPLINFLQNILKNPDSRAVEELYLFLEHNKLPITPDGCFLAYRRVGANFESLYANPDGTRNSNRPGETVTMDRKLVDPRRNKTCSKGLHFCSMTYLPSYGGAKTVIVKIDPADVVSIPSDYNNQKGRCCKYEVIGEYLPNDNKEVLDGGAVYEVTPTDVNPLGARPSTSKYYGQEDYKDEDEEYDDGFRY